MATKEFNIKIPGPCPPRAPKKEVKKNKLPECPPWGCPPPICPMFPFPSYGCLPFPRPPLETFNCPMCNPNPIFSTDKKKGSSSSNNSSGGSGGCGCGGGSSAPKSDLAPKAANPGSQHSGKVILTPCSSTSVEPPATTTANNAQQTLAGAVPQNMATSYSINTPQQQQQQQQQQQPQQQPNMSVYNQIPQQQRNITPYNNYAPQNMRAPYSYNNATPQNATMNPYNTASGFTNPYAFNTPQAVNYSSIKASPTHMTPFAYLVTPPQVNKEVEVDDNANVSNNANVDDMMKAPEVTSVAPEPEKPCPQKPKRTNCGGLPCNLPCGPLPGPVLPPKPQGCRCKMGCGAPCPPCPPAARPPTLTPKCQYPDNPCNGVLEPCPPAAGVPPGCQRDENCQSIVCPE